MDISSKGSQNTQKLLSTDLVNTDHKSSNARSRSDWISFQAAFKRRIFGRPKNLTGHFVHREPFNIFALFKWNFERQDVLMFVRLRRSCVNGTPKTHEFF